MQSLALYLGWESNFDETVIIGSKTQNLTQAGGTAANCLGESEWNSLHVCFGSVCWEFTYVSVNITGWVGGATWGQCSGWQSMCARLWRGARWAAQPQKEDLWAGVTSIVSFLSSPEIDAVSWFAITDCITTCLCAVYSATYRVHVCVQKAVVRPGCSLLWALFLSAALCSHQPVQLFFQNAGHTGSADKLTQAGVLQGHTLINQHRALHCSKHTRWQHQVNWYDYSLVPIHFVAYTTW